MELNGAPRRPDVEIRIDTLRCSGVDGLNRRHAGAIARAFTTELRRLLTDEPPESATPVEVDDADDLGDRRRPRTIRPGPPHRFGVELAREVHRSVASVCERADQVDEGQR